MLRTCDREDCRMNEEEEIAGRTKALMKNWPNMTCICPSISLCRKLICHGFVSYICFSCFKMSVLDFYKQIITFELIILS